MCENCKCPVFPSLSPQWINGRPGHTFLGLGSAGSCDSRVALIFQDASSGVSSSPNPESWSRLQALNGYSGTWAWDPKASESQLCLYCFLVSHLWWKLMCINSCQSMGYRGWENRTMGGGRITALQTTTASAICFSCRTSEQRSIKMLLSLVFEGQREESSLGVDLESFSQNWVSLLFAVTLEIELCSGRQMGSGSGAQRRNSFSQPGFCQEPGSTVQ